MKVAGNPHGEQADEMLAEMETGPTRSLLTAKIHSALDPLEADLGFVECRRRRFANLGVRGIPVSADKEDWLTLWEPHNDDETLVAAIIPAP